MISARKLSRHALKLIALGVFALYVALSSGASGCGGDQACIQWAESEGPCPAKAEAIRFMAPNCDLKLTIESDGDYDGVTCCYEVNKEQLDSCPIDNSTVGAVTAGGPGPGPGPTVTSATSGPGFCDGMGDCTTCQDCAAANNCSFLVTNCVNNTECTELQDCLVTCAGEETCANTCQSVHSSGVQDLQALDDCKSCQECPSDCGCTP